jgi:putative oxidoreductase
MRIVVGMLGVLGRILLCTVFLAAAVGYTAPDVHSLAEAVAAKAAVAPTWILIGALVVLAVGSLSVVVGYKARFGALALLAFLVLATYLFHGFTFWNVVNTQARHDHIVYLVMNLSIMGAMLLIVVNGAGQMSLDGKRR